MTTDRDLLWKAYPDGYLAYRGVSTLGGWLTVAADDDIWPQAIFVGKGRVEVVEVGGSPDRQDTEGLQGSGDLLPKLDPKDTATWACALRDLAEAVGSDLDPKGGLVFTRQAERGLKHGDWLLCDWNGDEIVVLKHTKIADPAKALCQARIGYRT